VIRGKHQRSAANVCLKFCGAAHSPCHVHIRWRQAGTVQVQAQVGWQHAPVAMQAVRQRTAPAAASRRQGSKGSRRAFQFIVLPRSASALLQARTLAAGLERRAHAVSMACSRSYCARWPLQ